MIRLSRLLLIGLLLGSPLALAAGEKLEQAIAAFNQGDYKQAFMKFMPLARKGNAEAQYYLGGIYLDGLGVTANSAKGVEWMEKAIAQYHRDAATTLGKRYLSGMGVTMDATRGTDLFKLAESFPTDAPPADDCD